MRIFALFCCVLAASGCSIFESGGDEVVFDTALGPQTKAQIRTLPPGLVGDEKPNRYLGDTEGAELSDQRPGEDDGAGR